MKLVPNRKDTKSSTTVSSSGGASSAPTAAKPPLLQPGDEEPFLRLNGLETRWKEIKSGKPGIFVIADLNFGKGIRFLDTSLLWKVYLSQHNTTLHYVAYAASALTREQLHTLGELPNKDQEIIQEIRNSYPPNQVGTHRIWLPTLRIALTLIIGDIKDSLKTNHFLADCWYLDFVDSSPARSDLPSSAVKALISTFYEQTTFVCKGTNHYFNEQLQTIGFDSNTIQNKQCNETITAGQHKANSPLHASPLRSRYPRFPTNRPWFNHSLPSHFNPEALNQAIVIGTGMAGAWTARTLAERGMNVVVVDKSDEVAPAASGNPVGVLYVKPGTEYTKATKLAMIACTNANARMMTLKGNVEQIYDNCGVLQLLNTDTELHYAKKLVKQSNFAGDVVNLLTKEEASTFANTSLDAPALLFSKCGRVFPRQLCIELLRHPKIKVQLGFDVQNLAKSSENNFWHLQSTDKRTLSAQIVVIAAAIDTLKLKQTSHLPLKPIRGQVSIAQSDAANNLKTVLCGDGYVAKTADKKLCFGASFVLGETNTDINEAETLDNLGKLRHLSATLHKGVTKHPTAEMANRVSVRATTPDYMPLVGPVADDEKIRQDFFHLTKDSNYRFSSVGSYYEGLYVNVGHGSKGLTTSPISAEIISDYIFNAPFSIDRSIIEALHPTRFTIRALIKNRINKE
jgi:tRNA 5-methylaminomethyl-2-thiouridine biosynthesis bifunctional protein